MSEPLEISGACARALLEAIQVRDLAAFEEVVESEQVDVNGFVDGRTLLCHAVANCRATDLAIVRILLERGADPDLRYDVPDGNPLHVALSRPNLTKVACLLVRHGADVRAEDIHGCTPLFVALRERRLQAAVGFEADYDELFELLLSRGADPYRVNQHGVDARAWLDSAPYRASIEALIEKHRDAVYTPSTTVHPPLPTTMRHLVVLREIWQTLVPPSGACETVQGELVRAIEKLRDEAIRNGNANFGPDHTEMVAFLRSTFIGCQLFSWDEMTQVQHDTDLLSDAERPCMDETVFDRLADLACEFYLAKPEPIPFVPYVPYPKEGILKRLRRWFGKG